MIKTHIPARPRNKKIVPTGGASISPSISSAVGSSHTHNNKSLIDLINQGNIDVLSKLFVDAEGNLYTTENFYSQQGVSAYGPGVEGDGGVDISKLLSWAGYTAEMADYYAPASLLVPFYNDMQSRVGEIENTDYAELDSSGKVLSSQLPSYVDDVMEFASFSALPTTGESGKIYITTDTNRQYRWTGTTYAEISSSLALGETSSTAYRGDRGKAAYDHISDIVKHITATERTNWNAAHAHISNVSNPHSVTKAQVGLGNVDNTSDAGKPISTATQTALNEKADTTALTAHTSSTSNPHSVTASQVGLGNVLNVASYSKTESDAKYPTLTNYNAHVADAVKHITSAERTAWNAKADDADLTAHEADTVKHVTALERTAWNGAVTDQHTHANKTQIDGITALHLQILSKLNVDASGNLYATENFYSVGGISAYGPGIGDDSGIQSAYDVWLSAGNTGTKDDFFAAIVAPAITAVQSYTEAEKLIARTNIGALSASAVNDVTNYNEITI